MSIEQKLTQEARSAFSLAADFLIPAYGKMPSATSVEVDKEMLEKVLEFRPDIADAFFRGLSKIDTGNVAESLNSIFREDPDGFNAISLAASAGYYMTESVRQLLGYPGQESLKYDTHEVPDFMMDHMLERVAKRGTIYRTTPTK